MTMIDIEDRPSSLWRDAWRRLRRNRLAVVGLVIIAALLVVAVFGPWLSPYDFLSQNLDLRNQPPSAQHWLGTDDLGRDVLSRLIYGARTAFMVAVGVTVVAVLIGVVLGAIAGFYGGWFDRFVMWFTDITMSVPQLLLVVVINASLKQPISLWMEARYMETLNPIYRNSQIIDFVLVGAGAGAVGAAASLCHGGACIGVDQPADPDALCAAQCDGAADRGRIGGPWHRDGAGKRVFLPWGWGDSANAKLGEHDLGRPSGLDQLPAPSGRPGGGAGGGDGSVQLLG
jgi:hypothetical protein